MSDERMKEALLADLVSRDTQRIWSATWAVIKTRDAEALAYLATQAPSIAAATNGIEMGGMLQSNRRSLDFALRKLAFFEKRAGCLCELYPEIISYQPEQEQEAGHVRVVSKVPAPYSSKWVVSCVRCGKRYEVEEGEGHFTYWEWKAMP